MSIESSAIPSESLFKRLSERRVPQIFGIYLGTCWALVQFVDWLVNRYYFSHHLTDMVLTILVSIIPVILVLAYFHGKPGADRWTRFEKIGIPVNLALSGLLVFILFGDKNLGSSIQKVRLKNEKGEEIVRTIPKKDFLKKIVAFYFEPEGEVADLDWQAWALPLFLANDLNQDPFFKVTTPFDINPVTTEFLMSADIEAAGYKDGVGLPLLLQAKLAEDRHFPLFIRGSLAHDGDLFRVKYRIYFSKNKKLKKSGELTSNQYLNLIDQLSVAVKKAVEVPKVHMEEVPDIPLADLMTNSAQALKAFIKAHQQLVASDLDAAIALLEAAIAFDPAFAYAYTKLQYVYLTNNQAEKRIALFKPLMRHLYKLPERDQYFVKADYYITKQEGDKAYSVLEMVTQLFPQDITGWAILGFFQTIRHEFDDAIATNKHILEMDPTAYNTLHAIGNLYLQQGKYAEAASYFRQYAEAFPEQVKSHQALGELHLSKGEFEEASAYFEKALLIEPENITILLKTGEVAAKAGKFERTRQILDQTLAISEKPADRFAIFQRLEQFHNLRGEINQAFQVMGLKDLESAKFQKPFFVLFGKLQSLELYVEAGKTEEARALLAEIGAKLTTPFDRYIAIGEIVFYSATEDAEPLQAAVNDLDALIKSVKNELLRPGYFQGQAKVYELDGDFEKALIQYRQNQKMLPDNPGLFRQIGRCLRELGRLDEAEASIKKSLAIRPFSPKAHYEMALLQQRLGKSEKAADHLDRALDIWKDADPEYKPAAEARAKKEAWRKFS